MNGGGRKGGCWWCKSCSVSKTLRIRSTSRCPKAGEDGCLRSSREREFAIPLLSCSAQALNGLDEVHPHRWRQSSLPSLLIQILISSEDTLTDTPRNNVYQLSGHLLTQSRWHKINLHSRSCTYYAGIQIQAVWFWSLMLTSTHFCLPFLCPSLGICGVFVKQNGISQEGMLIAAWSQSLSFFLEPLSFIGRTGWALSSHCLLSLPGNLHIKACFGILNTSWKIFDSCRNIRVYLKVLIY